MRVRQSAVHYACSVFPFHHVPSRFACMLACGDRWVWLLGTNAYTMYVDDVCIIYSQGDIREEGKKGLKKPPLDSLVEGVAPKSCDPPDFYSMTEYLYKRVSDKLQIIKTTSNAIKNALF